MVKKKTRLGRGLGALLGDVQAATDIRPSSAADKSGRNDAPASADSSQTGFREIPIEQLQRGQYQPRIRIDKAALVELGKFDQGAGCAAAAPGQTRRYRSL